MCDPSSPSLVDSVNSPDPPQPEFPAVVPSPDGIWDCADDPLHSYVLDGMSNSEFDAAWRRLASGDPLAVLSSTMHELSDLDPVLHGSARHRASSTGIDFAPPMVPIPTMLDIGSPSGPRSHSLPHAAPSAASLDVSGYSPVSSSSSGTVVPFDVSSKHTVFSPGPSSSSVGTADPPSSFGPHSPVTPHVSFILNPGVHVSSFHYHSPTAFDVYGVYKTLPVYTEAPDASAHTLEGTRRRSLTAPSTTFYAHVEANATNTSPVDVTTPRGTTSRRPQRKKLRPAGPSAMNTLKQFNCPECGGTPWVVYVAL